MATSIFAAIQYAQQLCQTDSNGISSIASGNGLAFANDALENFTRSLVERNIKASQVVESSATITTTGIFAWPSDMWALETIEVNYMDTTQNNYLQAQNVELANTQGSSFDWLRVNQPTSSPLFSNHGDTGEIFPTPANSITAKIFYYQTPTEYVDIGNPIVYPATLDYRLLGARIAALYKTSLSDFAAAQGFNVEYDKRVADIIKILAPASQQPIQAEPLHISGFNY